MICNQVVKVASELSDYISSFYLYVCMHYVYVYTKVSMHAFIHPFIHSFLALSLPLSLRPCSSFKINHFHSVQVPPQINPTSFLQCAT